jgi:hypothetical protein
MTHRKEDESDQQYDRRVSLNTSTGALGGGALGASLPLLYRFVTPEKKELIDRFMDHPIDTALGTGFDKTVETLGAGGLIVGGAGAVAGKAIGAAANSSSDKAIAKTDAHRASAEASQIHANAHGTPADITKANALFNESVKAQQAAIEHSNNLKTKWRYGAHGGKQYHGTAGAVLGTALGIVGEKYMDKL